ncbi:MAG: VOC family protein [Gaiellales bacterium]
MSKPSHPTGGFCWFECGSTDAAAAKKFYTQLFGWKAEDVPMPGDMEGSYTLFKVGDEDMGGLYQLSGPQFEGVPSSWTTYVKADSTDQIAERATALGARAVTPPMDVPGVGRIAFVQDPTGAHIGVFQSGEHPGSAQLGPVEGAIGWSELATRDTERARAFYTELFDWGAKVDDAGPIPYTEFQVAGKSIGGMMEMTPQHGDAPPHWLPYVLVSDCNASAAKATELGGKILVPPTDIPNVGRFAVFSDPTGACLAIIRLTMPAG